MTFTLFPFSVCIFTLLGARPSLHFLTKSRMRDIMWHPRWHVFDCILSTAIFLAFQGHLSSTKMQFFYPHLSFRGRKDAIFYIYNSMLDSETTYN